MTSSLYGFKVSATEKWRRELDIKIAQDAAHFELLINPPQPPNKHQCISRRQWLNQIKDWRLELYTFHTPPT